MFCRHSIIKCRCIRSTEHHYSTTQHSAQVGIPQAEQASAGQLQNAARVTWALYLYPQYSSSVTFMYLELIGGQQEVHGSQWQRQQCSLQGVISPHLL